MAPSPSSLVESYEALLANNLAAVQSIESGLRNITWLLPGRFQDAELASEGLYALLNLVSGYHDNLLSKHLDPALTLPPHPFVRDNRPSSSQDVETPPNSSSGASGVDEQGIPRRITPPLPGPSEHARYTKYWTNKSSTYRTASRMLVTITYIQLLLEMLARKRSDGTRWKLVLYLETLKTSLRLIVMGITKRPVLSPAVPQREYDLTSLPSSLLHRSKSSASKTASTSTSTSPLPSSIPSVPSPNRSEEANRPAVTLLPRAPLPSHLFPLSSALPEEYLPHPLTLLPELEGGKAWTGEILNSAIPLLHVILLLRASRQSSYRRKSLPSLSSRLSPFLIPILLSLLARSLRSKPTEPQSSSLLLSEHYAQLDRQIAMRALLTGPMWIGWTRPKIMGLAKALERVPILGLAGELLEGYLPLVDDYFYYTSS